MATTTQAQRTRGDGAASRTRPYALDAPPRAVRARRDLVVGLVVMLAFALGAALLYLRGVDRDPALVLRRAVAQGEVIEASDVGVAYVSGSETITRLADTERARVVGRVARTDLPAGTLLTPAQVAEVPPLGPGEGMVGLSLEPGQVPASGLVPGDRVNVVAGPASQGTAAATPDEPVVLVEAAVVVAVEALGTQDRRFVSLKMSEADANEVAAAAERGSVRLVLVVR